MDLIPIVSLATVVSLASAILIGTCLAQFDAAPVALGCRNCSAALDDALDHCPRCGTPLFLLRRSG